MAASNVLPVFSIYSNVKVNETSLSRARAGDRDAAEDVLQSVWSDAYRIAWSVLHEANAAEDAAQEACARAWLMLGTLRDQQRFPVWFYRIVVNECNRRKRLVRRDLLGADRSPVLLESSQDERIDLRRAIENLPESLRLVIVLRYYYDLTGAEIAEIVHLSAATVRWRLMVAHRRLRETLEGYRPSPPSAKESTSDAGTSIAYG